MLFRSHSVCSSSARRQPHSLHWRGINVSIKNIFSWEENKLPLLGYALIVVYILLIDVLGFFVSTTIFMVGYMLFLKMRKPLTLMLVTLGVDVFVYFLFVMQLKLNLPSGLLI